MKTFYFVRCASLRTLIATSNAGINYVIVRPYLASFVLFSVFFVTSIQLSTRNNRFIKHKALGFKHTTSWTRVSCPNHRAGTPKKMNFIQSNRTRRYQKLSKYLILFLYHLHKKRNRLNEIDAQTRTNAHF